MSRIKRGKIALKRRKKVLKQAKGFMWRRKSHYRAAKEALLKAGKYAYRDRRNKKRTFRSLWILRLNAALREHGEKYSSFIKKLTDKKIAIDRKVLSQMAMKQPEQFKKFVESVK
ncbi:MAG: 50S ribosomal protein L20 [Candidatus Moranbacteria bacterium CG_4_10_14_3_um_filter_44_15]|nr:MAG: 50S ribosomal protein L20 [Candidatus Moranbacteria bacterium CG06_land_8_20_14_3_00_43_56]PIV84495.1 MAG: 50S ribosomal protein L20 [Candidatus Moranbacteria bacterium CG17_big_fil_post_rev_8_21_14_2_50_44_12]PIW93266.1 MAG: 50S ribosomal protein L20 [Candidatus Moranbacteria bacterium CG_4_8_14_3_um_filter_43_15]PIX90903.1 MAG: 50S ribosomal protein L20 [Candidatus Moranbacteria bacterium CG_4_10_14_3_um_filter_44_15]PJA85399.1 MAG: 50S ribosomal protein L20 [Candidatus Moranbacteria 